MPNGSTSCPGIPDPFFAWFYMGLLSAGVRFLLRWGRSRLPEQVGDDE